MEDKSDKRQNFNTISLVAIVAIVAIVGMVFFNQKSARVMPMSEEMLADLEAGQSETGEVLLGQAVTPPIPLSQGLKHELRRGTESMANFYIDNIIDVPPVEGTTEGKKQVDWCVTTTANTQSGVSEQRYTITLTSKSPLEIVPNFRVVDTSTKRTFVPTNVGDEDQDVTDEPSRLRGKQITASFITHSGADGFCVRTKESPSNTGRMMTLQVSSGNPFTLYGGDNPVEGCGTVKKCKRDFRADISTSTAQGTVISLNPSKTIVKAGTSFQVIWSSTGSRTANDWITLMKVGTANAEGTVENGFNGWVLDGETEGIRGLTTNPRNPWFYICADPACSPLPSSGRRTLKAPSKNPDGSPISASTQYELRYYENDGYTRKDNPTVARIITVTPTRVSTPTCTGTTPSSTTATLCLGDNTGLTANTPKTVVNSCSLPEGSPPKCEYKCNNGFHVEGNSCVADTVTTQPSPPTSLTASCAGVLAISGSEKILANFSWTPSLGATSYLIRIVDQNAGTTPAINPATMSNQCASLQSGDFCTLENSASSHDKLATVPSHSYKWWIQACNSLGCSSPTEALTQISCRFKFGGVTLTTPSISTGPAEQINPTLGRSLTVTFTVPQGITASTNDVITFAKDGLPITHINNHRDRDPLPTADNNGIVTRTSAEAKFGQGTVKQLPSTTARSVTINAPIVPGQYKIRYYDNAGTGETLKTWETLSYFAGESDATITVT